MPGSDSDSENEPEKGASVIKEPLLKRSNLTEELEKKIEALKLENRSLEDKNKLLGSENKSLQDQYDSHASKGEESGGSEDLIIEAFSEIFSGIETFVSKIISHRGFEEAFELRFHQHLIDKAKGKGDLFAELHVFENMNWREIGKLRSCATLVLSLIISRQVFRKILKPSDASKYGRIYPFGAEKADLEIISKSHPKTGMENGKSHLGSRQQKQKAVMELMFSHRVTKNVRMEADAIIKRTGDYFAKWTGQGLSVKQEKMLQDKVIDRAIDALELINESSREYVYVGNDRYGVLPQDISNCEVVNIADWSKSSREKALDLCHCLYPGLARKENDVDPFQVLINPTVLGYDTPDLRAKIKDHKAESSHSSSRSLKRTATSRSILENHPIVDYVLGSPSRKGRKR